ncbi:MAG: hypothetical protein RL701_1186 [Pseudomonadota bacterium]|jgi:2-polyprenyl-3-methyl-5-hydroxy-6-metoxy-1,4-benzoquinol methylase
MTSRLQAQELARRTGDTVAIPGEYQHHATHQSAYGAQRFWHQQRFQTCVELLDVASGMRILDAGCGSGVFADRVAHTTGVQVLAVDANEAAVRFARETYARPNLTVQRGHVDTLALEPASFDRIACLEVIEHIHLAQARVMLATFAKLLKPGGKLLVSTPNARSAWPAIEWLLDRLKLTAALEGEQHVITYNARTLSDLALSVGLTPLASRTLFIAAPFLAAVSWPLAERLHALEQRLPLAAGALLLQVFAHA